VDHFHRGIVFSRNDPARRGMIDMIIGEWIHNGISWDRQREDGGGPAAVVRLDRGTGVFSWSAEVNELRCAGTAETLTGAQAMADLWLRVHLGSRASPAPNERAEPRSR
jgi:hypothetical protein